MDIERIVALGHNDDDGCFSWNAIETPEVRETAESDVFLDKVGSLFDVLRTQSEIDITEGLARVYREHVIDGGVDAKVAMSIILTNADKAVRERLAARLNKLALE